LTVETDEMTCVAVIFMLLTSFLIDFDGSRLRSERTARRCAGSTNS